ncbi:MAG: GNAT family N-acetyltransferase [Acetobacteraceae bacterium]|nr:GNAT family N-acetyltransferase [Acetobacteraceae bacterium]
MRLTLHTAPDPAVRARLFAMIDRYNDDATGRTEPVRHLSIPLRDAAGMVEGGLVGISYYDWLIVEMLFVPRELRGHGMGTQLMRAAEAVAAARGCRGVWLDTASEAAAQFYRRLGYRAFAELADQPPGHARRFLSRMEPRGGGTAGFAVLQARDAATVAVVRRALGEVGNALMGTDPGRATLAILAEDEAGAPQGGLWMQARWGWLFLDLFILEPAARRGGTGSRILALAEAEAQARGCVGVWLDSYGFQAPEFYRRHGYQVIGTLPNYPAPHGRYFLAKRF